MKTGAKISIAIAAVLLLSAALASMYSASANPDPAVVCENMRKDFENILDIPFEKNPSKDSMKDVNAGKIYCDFRGYSYIPDTADISQIITVYFQKENWASNKVEGEKIWVDSLMYFTNKKFLANVLINSHYKYACHGIAEADCKPKKDEMYSSVYLQVYPADSATYNSFRSQIYIAPGPLNEPSVSIPGTDLRARMVPDPEFMTQEFQDPNLIISLEKGDGSVYKTIKNNASNFSDFSFIMSASSDGQKLYVNPGSRDEDEPRNSILIVDINTEKIDEFYYGEGTTDSPRFSSNGRYMAYAGYVFIPYGTHSYKQELYVHDFKENKTKKVLTSYGIDYKWDGDSSTLDYYLNTHKEKHSVVFE